MFLALTLGKDLPNQYLDVLTGSKICTSKLIPQVRPGVLHPVYMAAELTGPHGLKKYTAGTDLIPGRAGHNSMVDLLNNIPGLGIGPLSARPVTEAGLRFWVEESTSKLFVNAGTAWVGIADIGGAIPSAVAIGGDSSEGVSARGARADHTHRIPYATSESAGAMSSQDKARLDASTHSATPNTLVSRGAAGEVNVAVTSAASNAARKDYVDSKTWAASAITSGVLDPARVQVASQVANGLLSAADKKKLDEASTSGANNIMTRNSGGTTRLNTLFLDAEPGNSNEATHKGYVDSKKWSGSDITSGLIPPARIANASSLIDGLMSAVDKGKLDSASPSSGANRLIQTDTNGDFSVNNPVSGTHPATKSYVDSSITALGNTKSDNGHKHSAADITGGTINPARIANASNTTDGLMSSADKVKLDGATPSQTPGQIVARNGAGDTTLNQLVLSASAPSAAAHATRKDYVDAHNWNASSITSGVMNPSRIAKVSSATDGLMSSADKVKLDASTASNNPDSIVQRNAAGNFSTSDPSSPSHVATKSYVDGIKAKGHVTVNATANVPTSVNISFPPGQFATTPAILLTPYGAQGSYAGPLTLTNVSLTGATINLTRTTTGEAIVAWAAIA